MATGGLFGWKRQGKWLFGCFRHAFGGVSEIYRAHLLSGVSPGSGPPQKTFGALDHPSRFSLGV